MPTKRKPAAKKKAAPKRHVAVPHEELNAIEQALADAQKAVERAYARLKKWYRS